MTPLSTCFVEEASSSNVLTADRQQPLSRAPTANAPRPLHMHRPAQLRPPRHPRPSPAAGPPGCGKGTQSPAIKKEHCLCHLATGDMLRSAVAAQTPLGLEAKKAMDAGALVSDDLVVGLIEEAMQARISSLYLCSCMCAHSSHVPRSCMVHTNFLASRSHVYNQSAQLPREQAREASEAHTHTDKLSFTRQSTCFFTVALACCSQQRAARAFSSTACHAAHHRSTPTHCMSRNNANRRVRLHEHTRKPKHRPYLYMH